MTANNLWSFAVTVYQGDGVAPACLDLQEKCRVDVPLMLCAAFACLQGKRITAEDLQHLQTLASPWQTEIVRALRRIRTQLKTGPHPAPTAATDELRNTVKAAELAAEKIQLEMMQVWADALPAASVQAGAPSLSAMIDSITRIVTASSPTDITPSQHDHIRLISAAALQTSDAENSPDNQA